MPLLTILLPDAAPAGATIIAQQSATFRFINSRVWGRVNIAVPTVTIPRPVTSASGA